MKEKIKEKVDSYIEKLLEKEDLTLEEFTILDCKLAKILLDEDKAKQDKKMEDLKQMMINTI